MTYEPRIKKPMESNTVIRITNTSAAHPMFLKVTKLDNNKIETKHG